jgi:pimeloyl-ACP methyl ester carboxylesterase
MQIGTRLVCPLATTAILAAVLYFALSPAVVAPYFLFHGNPSEKYKTVPVPAEVLGAKKEDVEFKAANGSLIRGMYFVKPGARWTVLLHHGRSKKLSTQIGLARTLLLAGCSVLVYDYEGFGNSTGTASNANLLADAQDAYKFLLDTKHVEPASLVQCGVSLGTGVAAQLSQRMPCAAVVLISPYRSLNELLIVHAPAYKLYPDALFPSPDLGCAEFVKSNRSTPILLIHGRLDKIIPVANSLYLNSICSAPHKLVIVPNAHHGDFSTVLLSDEIRKFVDDLPRQM